MRALPKAHLHVHLEGTVRPATLRDLAATHRVPLPDPSRTVRTFDEFFLRKQLIAQCLRRPEDFRRIAREFCEDEAAAGTRYAEVSFTAAAHGERLGDLQMPLASVLEGLAEGSTHHHIECQVILDHSRRRSLQRAWHTLRLAERYAAHGVVGIGLAGDESFPLTPFAEVFHTARDGGLHVVHHAGESGGPDNIREAVTVGRAERIGHGISILDDPDLLDQFRDLGIPLEVCPSSNITLGLVPEPSEHPLTRMLHAGLTVTVNADDPAILGITLADEYLTLRDTHGHNDSALAHLARTAVDASFAPEPTKLRLHAEIDGWLAPT